MSNTENLQIQKLSPRRSPKYKVRDGISSYLIFTIILSWSPIIVNYFVSYMFDVDAKKLILYTSEISFMTIILVSDNIKHLSGCHIFKRKIWFHKSLLFINAINIAFSLLFLGILNYQELLSAGGLEIIPKQFYFVLITYLLAALMGLGVQIGEKIYE